jgi:hypothetical protein
MAERCDLPLIVLDDLYWQDGPIPSEHEWAIKHGSLITMDRWIIDGDYRAVAPARFARSDNVVWIDPPLLQRWWRILVRSRRGYPAGLWDCLRWTTRYRRHGGPETAAALANAPNDVAVHHLRTRRAQQRFLAQIAS